MKISTIEKKLVYFKFWGNDYTWYIYTLKILGYILTGFYYVATFFNKKKTKYFNKKVNFFVLQRNKQIETWNKPKNDAFNKKFLKQDRYDFNGIFLPKVENTYLMNTVYDDTLKVYTEYGDNYSYTIVDELEKKLPEGTYCYIGKNGEDITIKNGYTVIDAGAWVGDFSAYAAKKGAHVYAFEPSPFNINLLQKTIEFNKNTEGSITIVPLGLGEKEEILDFYENDEEGNTGGNSFNIQKGNGNTKLKITTLDIWAQKNEIKKIDFIKSDIEGYERHLLRGATTILKEHEPVLSICTYHLPDDKEILKKIILEANPAYTILQRKMKLFAFVKK
ncbi:MAG: FkbM family methyltransferase [Candidatus Pacebacteria bacterium]|nr:FkbM family methyltransferase [Candidatus Paceibacterota bacterium]